MPGSSLALFALAWAAMCALSGALVTGAMLRGTPPARPDAVDDAEA